MNIYGKILRKILANAIQQHIRNVMYLCMVAHASKSGGGGGGRRISRLRTDQAMLARPYLKNKIQTKGLGACLKWKGICPPT
jgi:hypothetical protein